MTQEENFGRLDEGQKRANLSEYIKNNFAFDHLSSKEKQEKIDELLQNRQETRDFSQEEIAEDWGRGIEREETVERVNSLQESAEPQQEDQQRILELAEEQRRQLFERIIAEQRDRDLARLAEQDRQDYLDRLYEDLERQYQEQQRADQRQLQKKNRSSSDAERTRAKAKEILKPKQKVESQSFSEQNIPNKPKQTEKAAQQQQQPSKLVSPYSGSVDTPRVSTAPAEKPEQQTTVKAQVEQAPQIEDKHPQKTGLISWQEFETWYRNSRASDEFQLEVGLEKPQEITPAQLMHQQNTMRQQREQQAENLAAESIGRAERQNKKPIDEERRQELKNKYLKEINSNFNTQAEHRLEAYRSGSDRSAPVDLEKLQTWKSEAEGVWTADLRDFNNLDKIENYINKAQNNGYTDLPLKEVAQMQIDHQELKHQKELKSIDKTFQKVESLTPQQLESAKSAVRIAENWERNMRQIGIEFEQNSNGEISKEAQKVGGPSYQRLEEQAQKSEQNNSKKKEDQILVKFGEIDEWRYKAGALGRSDTHLASIDDIRCEVEIQISHPNEQVAISREEHNVMRSDKFQYAEKIAPSNQIDSSRFYTREGQERLAEITKVAKDDHWQFSTQQNTEVYNQFGKDNLLAKPLEIYTEESIKNHNAEVIGRNLSRDLEKAGLPITQKQFESTIRHARGIIQRHQPPQQETRILAEGKDLKQWLEDTQKLHNNYQRSKEETQTTKNILNQADKRMDRKSGVSTLSIEESKRMQRDRREAKLLQEKKQGESKFQAITSGKSRGRGR